MRWQGRRESSNVRSGGRGRARGGVGIGALVAGIITLLLTRNPFLALRVGMGTNTIEQTLPTGQVEELQLTDEEKELYDFSAVVLADTEDAWHELLPQYGVNYREPQMVIFQESIRTGCGLADSGVGPFYCGADETVYMDLSFYEMLIKQFGAQEGDFVMSYVISHEVGHHVQKCLGILDDVHRQQQSLSTTQANAMSVRLELMADYLAGVVAKDQEGKGYLDPGDIDEAIATAWVIGDDAIEKKFQGRVEPESFTHGSSDQRTRWYRKGYEAGDLSDFNTFDMKKYPRSSDL